VIRGCIAAAMSAALAVGSLGQNKRPAPEAFQVLEPMPPGPRITPFLEYQVEEAWREDDERRKTWESVRNEHELFDLQTQLRQKLLAKIGGLPENKTDLHAQITGKVQMDGFAIEKLIFQSLPGFYVTALVYVPDDHSKKHPAVLVPAGHAPDGKAHYQVLSQRLARRGYVVIAWDPVGQGERSQFWDPKTGNSRYNLICAEHAVMGNLAYLAGTNLARWEIWDGIRAVDYLLTRSDVDGECITITGTSGGGFQTVLIAALDPRIKAVVPSCYITALPMRIFNRIFADPDSDPEQDLDGMMSSGLDHPGLLLLIYPRPVLLAAEVLDFFPIEGTRKTFREVRTIYERFGKANRIAMVEDYHGHQFSNENQQAAIAFLDHFNGMPVSHEFPSAKELPDESLRCTRTGQVMLDYSDARSLMDLIREYYIARKRGSQRTIKQLYYGDGYKGIKDWRSSEHAGNLPHSGQITWEFRGTTRSGDVLIDRYLLRYSRYLEMPLLHIHATTAKNRHLLVWFSARGKASVDDWPEIEKYLNEGYDIISMDFRGLGETRMPYKAISPDDPLLGHLDFDQAYVNSISGVLADHVYNSLLLGRPYFLEMIEDAEIAARFAKEKLGADLEMVTAPGEAYTLASAISETLPGIKLLNNQDATLLKWSEFVEQKREVWPIQYLVPSGAYIH
jgi:cephalosporin-C deacetylase-like acetyl esterase